MSRFGVRFAISNMSSTPRSSSASEVKDITEIGVSCSDSSRRSAVTMISSSCCAPAVPDSTALTAAANKLAR
jgi:hypothetical protein